MIQVGGACQLYTADSEYKEHVQLHVHVCNMLITCKFIRKLCYITLCIYLFIIDWMKLYDIIGVQ